MGLSVMSMMIFCWEECYVPNHWPFQWVHHSVHPLQKAVDIPWPHPAIQFGEVAASQMKWCHSYTGDPFGLDSRAFFKESNPTLVITTFKVISFHDQTVSNVLGGAYDNLTHCWEVSPSRRRERQDTLHIPSQRRCWHNPRGQIDIPGETQRRISSIQPFHPYKVQQKWQVTFLRHKIWCHCDLTVRRYNASGKCH